MRTASALQHSASQQLQQEQLSVTFSENAKICKYAVLFSSYIVNVEVGRVSILHESEKGYGCYGWGELNMLIPSLATISKLAPAIKPAGINFPEL